MLLSLMIIFFYYISLLRLWPTNSIISSPIWWQFREDFCSLHNDHAHQHRNRPGVLPYVQVYVRCNPAFELDGVGEAVFSHLPLNSNLGQGVSMYMEYCL
ncbi:hypothetical protein F5Y05DRAFT_351248 [Hypoxylon sp. FL0543]|nr:hypothetical protein F5Y05DRAFT_351248 [Hypoxylon sp. FL0543]